jgi:hypothetical protein
LNGVGVFADTLPSVPLGGGFSYYLRLMFSSRLRAPALSLSISLLAGCAGSPAAGGQPAFRVRTDFTAPLNSDQGWAGALNETVTVPADRPFRVRLEVEHPPGGAAPAPVRLQYRRNGGDWTDVEAHDFPHPLRELELDFAKTEIGATPEGWNIAPPAAGGMTVAPDGQQKVARARAAQDSLTGFYTTPWAATEFTAAFRLPPGNRAGVAFLFGYVDAANHWRVFLDPGAGAVRVSRVVNGGETVAAEKRTRIAPGQWHDIEIQTEDDTIEVSYDDGAAEFEVRLEAPLPSSPFGFQVPAHNVVDFRGFTVAGEARTPRVSIVSCPAYRNGAETTDLLEGSSARFGPGTGISLADRTASTSLADSHAEFEWPIVIRRYADGAVTNEEGDTFELRMVDAGGAVFGQSRNPALRLTIPAHHVGGTFIETPGRIGPWQARNGDLYFMMEPAETDNLFMMIKSTDNGVTWKEVDGAHRPETSDLEAVDARQVGDTIHVIHQVTNSTRYHAFRTSDHPAQPDTWATRDEVAAKAESVAQAATLAVRSNGSIVAFYVADTVHYSIRSPEGTWGPDTILDPGAAPKSAGPRAVLGSNDAVHLAYYGMDGTLWYRRVLRDRTFTARQQLDSGLGTSRAEYGTVLPLVFIPRTDTLVIVYRRSDGRLWERRVVRDGTPTPAVRVTDRSVIQDAVDSQQPAADVVADGETLRALFVEEPSRSIFSTHDDEGWPPSILRVDRILGSWIRGNVYTRRDGKKVYGYIYDAGSDGGAGMNRFGEIELKPE